MTASTITLFAIGAALLPFVPLADWLRPASWASAVLLLLALALVVWIALRQETAGRWLERRLGRWPRLLGAAQSALTAATTYVKERKAFGRTLDQFQALQFKIAECEVKLQSARTFLRQAAWKLDNGAPDATKFCAMAKLMVTDVSFEVANGCLQLHGGYGYLADYGIEKIVRDLRVHQILEGTNEIMRLITARHLIG